MLTRLIQNFRSNKQQRAEAEANYFSKQDNQRQRSVAWSSIPYFQQQLRAALDLGQMAREHLSTKPNPHALALAPGDMSGEYAFLKAIGVASIDAFDLSEGQREKFFKNHPDPSVQVDYVIQDVNTLSLEPNRYDFVYVQQAFHHFENLEHVAQQINSALKEDGWFVLIDYVGANFLQRTPRQRAYCQKLWDDMPPRYRTALDGGVLERIFIPDKDRLSPFEAIRSEEMLGVLESELEEVALFPYAAILFPLFNGFAQNYTDSPEDQDFIRRMWALDQEVIKSGEVEPNFVRGIYRKRQ